jgi:hypothetical protein
MLDPILQGDYAVRQLRMRAGSDEAGDNEAKGEAESGSTRCQDDGPTVPLARRLRALR